MSSQLQSLALYATQPVVFQSVPEQRDGFENFISALEEQSGVELGGEEHLLELGHHMAGVLSLDAVVPGEKCDLQRGEPRGLDVQETVFQILPKASGGPVFDGKAGTSAT